MWNGKEYNEYGKLIFEGEYFNDKRLKGIIMEYDNFGTLTHKSEYKKEVKEYIEYKRRRDIRREMGRGRTGFPFPRGYNHNRPNRQGDQSDDYEIINELKDGKIYVKEYNTYICS